MNDDYKFLDAIIILGMFAVFVISFSFVVIMVVSFSQQLYPEVKPDDSDKSNAKVKRLGDRYHIRDDLFFTCNGQTHADRSPEDNEGGYPPGQPAARDTPETVFISGRFNQF